MQAVLSWRAGLQRALMRPWVKPLVFVLSLLPFAWLAYAAFADALGANPAEALLRSTGDWTLRFLCLVLAVTPLRQMLNLPVLARFRRMLGLYVFFYACLHLLCYAWFDMGLEWADIVADIPKRPFILVGFAAWAILLVLAATSPKFMLRALGGKRWQWLHRTVYAAAPLALLHFFWMRAGKNNFAEVAVYAAILAVLLIYRVLRAIKK
ncbi:sulfoxide reductase heme-binding subunit YedZ [Comamonas testosteroni]|uniref:Protein-methionine-sulfoxide reductase heme-binding subunit MsrQ n=1 Tax=Comamonas testosteroni TaxID=285 RepID=A0A373FBR8_COMTE|nr:protein-methionine-sulfoxide reductase heme-binding subunit MsrQ [Comamonas testosteroni]RGE41594.1 sulfoxide reductase heme-binding subunit YedZ [Comamonas testosteroni]